MQKLWEVQPQGLVLVLHPGQVQLCNCNNLKVAESTNWINKYFFGDYGFTKMGRDNFYLIKIKIHFVGEEEPSQIKDISNPHALLRVKDFIFL